MLQNGIVNIMELEPGKDWVQVRRELTDDKIAKIYHLYEGLWPLETDLLALLPKPDGEARAVYSGSIHPSSFNDFAIAAPLYFGELIVSHPFVNSGVLKKEMRPTENPKQYRQEFVKTVLFFLNVMPLVDFGLVNLIPDPCDFDFHLRRQMMRMARDRATRFDAKQDPRIKRQMEEDSCSSVFARAAPQTSPPLKPTAMTVPFSCTMTATSSNVSSDTGGTALIQAATLCACASSSWTTCMMGPAICLSCTTATWGRHALLCHRGGAEMKNGPRKEGHELVVQRVSP